jgi:hypothetical protein
VGGISGSFEKALTKTKSYEKKNQENRARH